MTITINLPDERLKELTAQAQKLGLSLEEYAAKLLLEARNAEHDADFKKAAEYVLTKDAELLKRLA